MPRLSARVRVELDGHARDESYALRGTPEQIAAEIRAFAALGVDHLAVAFPELDPGGITSSMERFLAEVVPLV
jgi:alkanesulfonate monooxygenase SsuD/methylene tetrahydromethanopterin reductase-like flavin-dependent oxidoreductase (luciferase family)